MCAKKANSIELKDQIKLVVGLGNPGDRFKNTRHNIGFRVVEAVAERSSASWRPSKDSEMAELTTENGLVTLVKPLTFMNSSGVAVSVFLSQGISLENLLVIHDDIELPFGTVKLRVGGSARGHNGIRSIIDLCGYDFARLRVGVGRPEDRALVPEYVLSNFSEDSKSVDKIINFAANEVEKILSAAI